MALGLPSIASGGGAIPITGGAATSGDAFSGDVRFAPVNVAGLFGSSATSSNPLLVPAVVIGGALLLFALLRRR